MCNLSNSNRWPEQNNLQEGETWRRHGPHCNPLKSIVPPKLCMALGLMIFTKAWASEHQDCTSRTQAPASSASIIACTHAQQQAQRYPNCCAVRCATRCLAASLFASASASSLLISRGRCKGQQTKGSRLVSRLLVGRWSS